ncbi:hypothetical protein ACW9IB_10295 [Pseudomonas sp. SDO524_S393]
MTSLMTLTSVAAFAEGGSERSKEFYNNFTFMQQQLHGTNEQTASADGKNLQPTTAEQAGAEQQPNS